MRWPGAAARCKRMQRAVLGRQPGLCYRAGVLDILLRGARLPGVTTLEDLGVVNGRLVRPQPEARVTMDLGGALVTPPLVEPHIHLDAVLTVGQPRPNLSGSLFEGIAIWADRVKSLTVEDVKRRAGKVLRWQLANGVQHVRTHVDVCDPELRALRALVELRQEIGDQMDLQLVAFPQQGIFSYEGGPELMRRAVGLGADVVGGIPHYELTRELGVKSVEFTFALAAEHGLSVDIHCDETDDDHSRFVEVMAAETIRLGMAGRVTASHTTAMHSYNNAYAYRLIRNLARAGMHMVTNPLDNSVLQGRFDSYPIRRGHTRVKELMEAGINVCIGHDSVMDPWYPLGYGDPVQAAFVLAHYGQMSGAEELPRLIDMITRNPARALGLEDYGLREGGPADLVAFDAPSEVDTIRLVPRRRLVLRRGRVVARTEPARTTVVWNGREEPVDFQP
jgi:cytosine deaminase